LIYNSIAQTLLLKYQHMPTKNNKKKKNKKKSIQQILLEKQLADKFKINKARLTLVTLFIIAIVQVCSVNLTKVAVAMSNSADPSSRYRRLQRFFSLFKFPKHSVARFVASVLPIDKYILSMDRTNWKWGKENINILVLGLFTRESVSR